MKKASLSLAVSAILFSGLALSQGSQICPVNPTPARTGCGLSKEPKNRARLLSSQTAQAMGDCIASCFALDRCLTFTFEPTSGTCKTYSRTANQMSMKASTDGTLFYNKACYVQQPEFRVRVVSGDASNGQYVYANATESGDNQSLDPAMFTSDDNIGGQIFSITCDGFLQNDLLGYSSRQSYLSGGPSGSNFFTDGIVFPSQSAIAGPYAQYVKQVSCSVDSSTSELSCTAPAGNVFYACTGNSNFYANGLSIASAGTPPAGTCNSISLFVDYLVD